MAVVVCLYSHRHGEDVFTFDTMETAYMVVAVNHILPQLDAEVQDPTKRAVIAHMIESRDYEDAVNEYNEYQANRSDREDFSFYETEVQTAPPVAVPTPTCPHCGEKNLEQFEMMETFRAYHPIRGLTEGGLLAVENALGTGCPSEHFGVGLEDYRVHCRSCLKDGTPEAFALPEMDWV